MKSPIRAIASLAFTQIILLIVIAYTYLASDGWYDMGLFLISLAIIFPFALIVVINGVIVRKKVSGLNESPSYRAVLKRTSFYTVWIFVATTIIGLIASVTTIYGGFIFMIVLVIGIPAIIVAVLLFSWTAWLYAKRFDMKSS